MDKLFDWLPIIWTARILLLILMGGGGYVFLLFLLRFLNWKTMKEMAGAPPPQVDSFSGEFGGAKAEVKLVAHGKQLKSVEERMTDLEAEHGALLEAVRAMRGDMKKLEKGG
jgi:hypothetical protein